MVSGRVANITDGRFVNEGPVARREWTWTYGCSGYRQCRDRGDFTTSGAQRLSLPQERWNRTYKEKYLMLKSRAHFRAGFGDVAAHIVECAGSGVCTSDYSTLDFRNVERPIYPLDAM